MSGFDVEKALLLDSQLCFAVYSTAHAFNRLYKPLLDKLGLTYPQYLVMMVLWEQDDLAIKEIGLRLHLDSGTLTPLLKRLEAAGMLTRTRSASDERHVRIELTEAGRALKQKAGAVPAGIFNACGMGLEELQSLRKQMVSLRQMLNAAADKW